ASESASCASSFFFSSRRRHTRSKRDWSSDVCSSDLAEESLVTEQTGRLRDWLIAKARVGGRLTALANVLVAFGGALVLGVGGLRSEERRVGKGGGGRWWA